MPLEIVDQNFLERQIAVARTGMPVFAIAALLECNAAAPARGPIAVALAYAALGAATIAATYSKQFSKFVAPVWVDLVTSAIFLLLTPSFVAFSFIFVVPAFAFAARGFQRGGLISSGVAGLSVATWAGIHGAHAGQPFVNTILAAVGAGVCTAFIGSATVFLGGREPLQILRRYFLENVLGRLKPNQGLSESVRQVLQELLGAFDCETALLAYQDDELERLFVWKIPPQAEPFVPESYTLAKSDAFLLDSLETTFCWTSLEGNGSGFGWDRRTFEPYKTVPKPTASANGELGARSLMAATVESEGRPAGRFILTNAKKTFTRAELRWFEEIVRQVNGPLESIFLLRHVRAHAIEAERSRISRDLHDSILQTLLSLQIQLDVLKRKVPKHPEKAEEELEGLRQIVKREGDELRRFVTDLRPVRVESADLRELMFGFAERFQREADMAVDLFVEDLDLQMPDRVCREIFQIYRESLNNIKKHAHASHVVVKLGQDEATVSLVVDDNGLGFSFSGSYSSEELDRLRLGPISIKERTRSVGGSLTVESNPGHGARLTVEIPLN